MFPKVQGWIKMNNKKKKEKKKRYEYRNIKNRS